MEKKTYTVVVENTGYVHVSQDPRYSLMIMVSHGIPTFRCSFYINDVQVLERVFLQEAQNFANEEYYKKKE